MFLSVKDKENFAANPKLAVIAIQENPLLANQILSWAGTNAYRNVLVEVFKMARNSEHKIKMISTAFSDIKAWEHFNFFEFLEQPQEKWELLSFNSFAALHFIVANGKSLSNQSKDIEILSTFLEAAETDEHVWEMVSSLDFAAYRLALMLGNVEMVVKLLEAAKTPEHKREMIFGTSLSSLQNAVTSAHYKTIFAVLEVAKTLDCEWEIISANNSAAFRFAARQGDLQMVTKFLEAAQTHDRKLEMISANNFEVFDSAKSPHQLQIFFKLLEEITDPQQRAQASIKILRSAATNGRLDIVRKLMAVVKNEADQLAFILADGAHACKLAMEWCHYSVISELLTYAKNREEFQTMVGARIFEAEDPMRIIASPILDEILNEIPEAGDSARRMLETNSGRHYLLLRMCFASVVNSNIPDAPEMDGLSLVKKAQLKIQSLSFEDKFELSKQARKMACTLNKAVEFINAPQVEQGAERASAENLTNAVSQKIFYNLIETMSNFHHLPQPLTTNFELIELYKIDPQIIDAIMSCLDFAKDYIVENKKGFGEMSKWEKIFLGAKDIDPENPSEFLSAIKTQTDAIPAVLKSLLAKPEISFSESQIKENPHLSHSLFSDAIKVAMKEHKLTGYAVADIIASRLKVSQIEGSVVG